MKLWILCDEPSQCCATTRCRRKGAPSLPFVLPSSCFLDREREKTELSGHETAANGVPFGVSSGGRRRTTTTKSGGTPIESVLQGSSKRRELGVATMVTRAVPESWRCAATGRWRWGLSFRSVGWAQTNYPSVCFRSGRVGVCGRRPSSLLVEEQEVMVAAQRQPECQTCTNQFDCAYTLFGCYCSTTCRLALNRNRLLLMTTTFLLVCGSSDRYEFHILPSLNP